MRRFSASNNQMVSLLDAFNFIGRRMRDNWDGSEAAALRLGQRAKAPNSVHERAHVAMRAMRMFAENGTIDLIYTDQQRRRVPYSQSTAFWLTAIYPDPVGTGEGSIELDDRDHYPCMVNIGQLAKWRSSAARTQARSSQKFAAFSDAADKYFETNFSAKNGDVIEFVRKLLSSSPDWPSKAWQHELIHRARKKARAILSRVHSQTDGRPDTC